MPTASELFQQGVQLYQAGQLLEAAGIYRQVLEADGRHAEAWHQLGCICLQCNQHETAFDYLRRAILLQGARADFHHNFAFCCRALGKLADAQTSYERALHLDPNSHGSRIHLCFTLYARGLKEQAQQCAVEALRADRNTAEDHADCGMLLLMRGEFAEGWPEYEWRLQVPQQPPRRRLASATWDGSPLAGRTLLVESEQGLGDTLQFVRYLPRLRSLDGRVVLAVRSALVPLLGEADVGELVSQDDPPPQHDVHTSIVSLPGLFGTALDTIPADVPYLRANPGLVALWGQRLAAPAGFRVGINWQGNRDYPFDRLRSIALAEFAPLARVPGVRLISLQKRLGREQIAGVASQFPLEDFDSELDEANGPFRDTAALMQQIDLVVTSDSATAHLAGALGVPVWVALPSASDWRWLLERDDSPWYPTMRLFRQTESGRWSDVFASMAAELGKLVSQGPTPRTIG